MKTVDFSWVEKSTVCESKYEIFSKIGRKFYDG